MTTKTELRIWAKNERSKLNMDEISTKLISKIKETEEYKTSSHVMIYYPLKNEVNLLPLLNDSDKKFYLPKIQNEELLCCPYKISDKLTISEFRTKEPMTDAINKEILDLIFVPALACDKNNYRLGYGGGFYDRFLSNTKTTTIVCIPKNFLINTIEPDAYDIPVTKVIIV